MTTRPAGFLRSIAAVAAFALMTGCAGASTHAISTAATPQEGAPTVIRFDNHGTDFVRVYLTSAQSRWLLGRVERDQHALLRVPSAALAEEQGWLQLSVESGTFAQQPISGDRRAIVSDAQPVSEMLAHQWTFTSTLAGGRMASLPISARTSPRP